MMQKDVSIIVWKSAVINDVVQELIEEMPSHLQNVTSDYDIEILIRELKPGTVNVYLKLSSLDNPRFNYRREIISNSMQPYVAATLMEVAKLIWVCILVY